MNYFLLEYNYQNNLFLGKEFIFSQSEKSVTKRKKVTVSVRSMLLI